MQLTVSVDLATIIPSLLQQQGLALIVETRTVDVPAGEGVIRFANVADGIITASVVIDGLPARITEQNSDFDLLTPGGLIRRSVGEVVRRVRTNPETGAETVDVGILRAANDGVALEINGRIEALQCSGQPERLVLDRVPEGLTDQPPTNPFASFGGAQLSVLEVVDALDRARRAHLAGRRQ